MIHDDDTRSAPQHEDVTRTSAPRHDSPSNPQYWNARQTYQRATAPAPSPGGLTLARVLPAALLVMIVLIAFLIMWMVLHHSSASRPTSAPQMSTTTTSPSTSSASTASASQTHIGPSTTVTPAPRTSISTATVTTSAAPTSSPTAGSAALSVAPFPAGLTNTCGDYQAAGSYLDSSPPVVAIKDPEVRVSKNYDKNSCDFILDAAQRIRSQAGTGVTSFPLEVPSAWRAANDSPGGPDVHLSCSVISRLSHCTSSTVDMYVR